MSFGDLSLARKRALADFLLREPNVTIGDLANRFGTSWQDMAQEIAQLSTVELVTGSFFETPFDVWIDDEDVSVDSLVRVSQIDSEPLSGLSLPEVVALLGATDVAMSSASQYEAEALAAVRERIAEAVQAHGYGSVLWPAPQLQAPPVVLNIVHEALSTQHKISIDYWKRGKTQPYMSTVTVSPVDISYVPYPLLIAANESGEVRRYRFDRITDAQLCDDRISARFARRMKSTAEKDTEVEGYHVQLWCHSGARWVAEEVPGATLRQEDDYDVIELPVRSEQWLLSLLVRLGPTVERIEKV